MQMSATKPELENIQYQEWKKSNGSLSKFGKEFHLFLIVVFPFSVTLGMIFLIYKFYHLWYCYFDPISIITLPN